MAGPQPNIALRNTPSDFNLSFGKNIFTLEETDGAVNTIQYQLNVLSGSTSGPNVATFRQFENPAGTAHFDLQNTLKNYTTVDRDLETITGITSAPQETFRFACEYGLVQDNGTFSGFGFATGSTGTYCVIGGRKDYYDLTWADQNQYISTISYSALGCPSSRTRVFALSDWTAPKTAPGNDTPSWASSESILTQKIPSNRNCKRTLSFVNRLTEGGTNPVNQASKTIKFFRVTIMDGETELDDFLIENTLSNNGGPNGTISGTTFDIYPYDVITVQAGHNMFTGNTTNATHWFIAPFTYQPSSCIGGTPNVNLYPVPLSYVYRFDVDEGECNDFEIVEFSWLNSFGFRDYFTFRKRRDYNINIERNTFERVEGSWNEADFEVNTYDRGEQVFSQNLTEVQTATTDYLTDLEAQFLKNLFISPDVRVQFPETDENWYPVVLENNQYTERTFRKDKFFQYSVNFRMAHKINSQRG